MYIYIYIYIHIIHIYIYIYVYTHISVSLSLSLSLYIYIYIYIYIYVPPSSCPSPIALGVTSPWAILPLLPGCPKVGFSLYYSQSARTDPGSSALVPCKDTCCKSEKGRRAPSKTTGFSDFTLT